MPLTELMKDICIKCYGGENCQYNDVLTDCPIYQKLQAALAAKDAKSKEREVALCVLKDEEWRERIRKAVESMPYELLKAESPKRNIEGWQWFISKDACKAAILAAIEGISMDKVKKGG